MITVDTSALVAILLGEFERDDFLTALDCADSIYISAGAIIEARMVVHGHRGRTLRQKLDSLMHDYAIKIVSPEDQEIEFADHVFAAYGKGNGHPAQLNFGDLFAYALAKSRDILILFKGNDFAQTDIKSAV